MFLLIVEIMLTVSAWRKGWHARALAPVGAVLVAGFLAGALIGPSVANSPLPILLDVAGIVALIAMNAVEPRQSTTTASTTAVEA